MEIVAKKFVFLIPSLPLPLQRKWPLMPSGMAAWEYRHTCWRGGKEKGKHRGWCNAPRGSSKGGATDKGKAPLSCRRHMSSNGLVCHARFGKSMARRFEDREDMTAGNSRRCRFTLAVPCIRRHFGCQKKTRKRKWIKRTCPFCTSI